jgi:hypothetical protein
LDPIFANVPAITFGKQCHCARHADTLGSAGDTPCLLYPKKESAVSVKYENVWALEPVLIIMRREKVIATALK